MSAIPALRRLRQEDHKFKVILDYHIVRSCLKKKGKITGRGNSTEKAWKNETTAKFKR
jgi:hypothetical protein